MRELQEFVDKFGFGISKEVLASKAYREMKMKGHDSCIVNGKYLEVDGQTYQFIKSKKQYRWIVKEF